VYVLKTFDYSIIVSTDKTKCAFLLTHQYYNNGVVDMVAYTYT